MAKEHRVSYQLSDGARGSSLRGHPRAAARGRPQESPLEEIVYTRLETFLPDEPVPAIHEDMADAIEMPRQPESDDVRYLESILEETPAEPPAVEVAMDDICLFAVHLGNDRPAQGAACTATRTSCSPQPRPRR